MPYAAVLAAALAVGACSGADPAPAETLSAPTGSTTASSATSPTSSAAPTTTASPSASEDPVLAKIPKEARPETQKGAEAFVRFYLERVNVAFSKPDPKALDNLSTSTCKACDSLRVQSQELVDKGHRYDRRALELTRVSAASFVNERKEVEAYVLQNQVKVVDARGAVIRRTAARPGLFLFTLVYDQRWKVVRLQAAKS